MHPFTQDMTLSDLYITAESCSDMGSEEKQHSGGHPTLPKVLNAKDNDAGSRSETERW